jgi:hypothetical protein
LKYGDDWYATLSEAIIGLRYQQALTDQWQFNTRLGIGIANTYGSPEQDGSWTNWVGFGIKLGASVQYFFWKDMYAELGADLLYTVTKDNPRLALKPSLAVGWQWR